jgi:hypothetical protein
MSLRKKHIKLIESIYSEPVQANIHWNDIEALFIALGAECSEGKGSRLRVFLNGRRAVFHRPHPRKEASKSMIRSIRRFLEEAGVNDGI